MTARLAAVSYRVFEGEESIFSEAAAGSTHDLGGEVVLIFQDGQRIFISWVSEPVQYAVGMKKASFFLPEALVDCDVSGTQMWAGLVGQEVSLDFVVADNQVLEVSSPTHHVLLCSFERGYWWADELTICREMPAPYGD